MGRRTYPLETLAQQRQRQVDEAIGHLASAVRAREQADARRLEAERRQAEFVAKLARVQADERAALEQGALSAADLGHVHAWQLRAEADRAALAQVEREATAAAELARSAERRGQEGVTDRRAAASAVERDRDRWAASEQRRSEAREEESAAEAWRAPR